MNGIVKTVKNAREVCASVKVRGKNPKSVWWNNKVKAAVRRKGAVWKEVQAASNEEAKERCMGGLQRGKGKD